MSLASWIFTVLLLCGITLLAVYSRTDKLFKCVFFTIISGFLSLGAAVLASGALGFSLALTPLTALASGVLGMPGVVALLVLNLI